MAFIAERNSMVFRAGTAPIWNRNETILPMAWKLQGNTIRNPGHDYTIQTIPTNSTAIEFDVRTNQPNFEQMFAKRLEQAVVAVHAKETYKSTFKYDDHDLALLDPDEVSEAIMDLVAVMLREKTALADEDGGIYCIDADLVDENTDLAEVISSLDAREKANSLARFAGKTLCRKDLCEHFGTESQRPIHLLDEKILAAYKARRSFFAKDTALFRVKDDLSLWNSDGSVCYIEVVKHDDVARRLDEASHDSSSRVFSEAEDTVSEMSTEWTVTDAFIEFLAGCESWDFASGKFDLSMHNLCKVDED